MSGRLAGGGWLTPKPYSLFASRFAQCIIAASNPTDCKTAGCKTAARRMAVCRKDARSLEIEENCVRHGRIVPFLGVMIGIHAVRLERAARRVIAGPPGRDRPEVTLRAIDGDRHLLRTLVDGDEDAGARGRSERYREEGAKQGRGKPTTFRRLACRHFAEKHGDTRRCCDPQA